jgi:aminopeptidase N
MEAWVFQVGHPEVMVTVGKKPGELVLTQRPFLLSGEGPQGAQALACSDHHGSHCC